MGSSDSSGFPDQIKSKWTKIFSDFLLSSKWAEKFAGKTWRLTLLCSATKHCLHWMNLMVFEIIILFHSQFWFYEYKLNFTIENISGSSSLNTDQISHSQSLVHHHHHSFQNILWFLEILFHFPEVSFPLAMNHKKDPQYHSNPINTAKYISLVSLAACNVDHMRLQCFLILFLCFSVVAFIMTM